MTRRGLIAAVFAAAGLLTGGQAVAQVRGGGNCVALGTPNPSLT